MEKVATNQRKARNLTLFVGCVLFWVIFDRITKIAVDSNYTSGEVIVRNVAHLFQFELVHNRGAAWGSFVGATPVFVLIAIAVCLFICFFVWKEAPVANGAEIVGLGLLVAGGLGNCVDRVLYGYVVDFITPTFIDFPTFNIADIGVTCGIILAAFGYIAQIKKTEYSEEHSQREPSETHPQKKE